MLFVFLVEGEDFDPGPYEAVFVAGQTNSSSCACVDIVLMDDDIFGSDHIFLVVSTTATPSAVSVVSTSAFVTIKDDDGELYTSELIIYSIDTEMFNLRKLVTFVVYI